MDENASSLSRSGDEHRHQLLRRYPYQQTHKQLEYGVEDGDQQLEIEPPRSENERRALNESDGSRYDCIGFLGGFRNSCPRRIFLGDASDVSMEGAYVRLMGTIISAMAVEPENENDGGDARLKEFSDAAMSIVIDDGTGTVEVLMRDFPSCFNSKKGTVQSLGQGGANWETVFPQKKKKRTPGSGFVSRQKRERRPKIVEQINSDASLTLLGQTVDSVGIVNSVHPWKTKLKRDEQVQSVRLVAHSVTIAHDKNSLTLRHLEIMALEKGKGKGDSVQPDLDVNIATGIFIAGNPVPKIGTFYKPDEKSPEDKCGIYSLNEVQTTSDWQTPLKTPKRAQQQHQQLKIRKSNIFRIIKSCSYDEGVSAEGISEADLLLILGCMDDGFPEEWAGAMREVLEELQADGEIYIDQIGNYHPL